jgi:eukaryotic-like serine/threonine-protein kinase
MSDTTPRCTGCGRLLGPEERFCPRCGKQWRANADDAATLVLEGGSQDPNAPGDDDEVTVPVNAPESGVPSSTADFNAWFRQVLGAEYELLSMIGQGGFARVYKARDLRLDRIVAIKVIRPDVVGTQLFVDSFRSEGVALAKLRHPAIIPIYDIRERGGLIYYIMPFVQGTTLEARLARGRLPPYETRRILSELTDALTAAHRAKMVHLDIKPANVFLEGDLQKVLLMDFGTAMAVTEVVEESSGGPVVGTPEYMSPEQARGLPEIDHRSDIYSLGALGYCMLMGRPPFAGRNAREILEKHVKESPVSIRKVNPTIPQDFADAIMRCLEKDPWDRFQTAKDLDVALQSVTFRSTQEYTSLRGESSGVHRTIVALIAGVALIVGLLAGLAIS